ncbi:MAG: hypothetical protein BWY43_00740 [candidate division WS2 bacterium ADurb.Bin280]|uniref:Uncharacterized protein n=1 Tax=candidate division WS2 bacterium ADurb.Bin280 TaxID=1852829 RepID=A0A1V5SBR3_9BACT|nr:MAG: hypothetical protein BWY43_00740 [candidate division WS2 bacterium ADurb.Bin280]
MTDPKEVFARLDRQRREAFKRIEQRVDGRSVWDREALKVFDCELYDTFNRKLPAPRPGQTVAQYCADRRVVRRRGYHETLGDFLSWRFKEQVGIAERAARLILVSKPAEMLTEFG